MKNFLFGVLMVTFSYTSARAATYKYHASNCIAVNGAVVAYGIYGINTTTSAAATVMCPLPPNFGNFTNQNIPFTVNFAAYDRSSAADLTCNLTVTGGSDGIVRSNPGASTSGNAGPVQLRSFSGNQSFGGDYSYILCTIPGVTSSGPSYLSEYSIDF